MIKYLIMDVDGTLTDGKIYMGNDGEVMKAFSIKDGYGISFLLKQASITPVIITGRKSHIVENRCKELGITNIYQGIINKIETLVKIVGKEHLGECAYIGDDTLDLECMHLIKNSGGLIGCPSDAIKEITAIANYICRNTAGNGAAREFIEWLLSKNKSNSENIQQTRVNEAIKYINNLNHKQIANGTYKVNDYFYYIVKELETQPKEKCIFESHKKYIDIQWVIEGQMAVETGETTTLTVKQPYDENKDVILWEKQENLMKMILGTESYIILYPNNAHISAMNTLKPNNVRLIVGKIKIN